MSTTAEGKVFIEDREMTWEPVGEGVKRKIMSYDDKLMLVKVEFDKGGVGILHHHYHSQITHVESGVFEVQIDGKKKVLRAGDAYYIPPHVVHGCVCLEAGVLIDVFSPMREDFVSS
ncbi:MAG TPA: cupin domain-containing protein [Chitinophagaceae bacterium]